MTIWVIEERWWRDNDYGGDWEDQVNVEDYGYFTDLEAAQAFADTKNDRRFAYDLYVERMDAGRADYEANYKKAIKRYETLVAAGFTDERKPEKPRMKATLPYGEWLKRNVREWTTYSPLEVKEHDED